MKSFLSIIVFLIAYIVAASDIYANDQMQVSLFFDQNTSELRFDNFVNSPVRQIVQQEFDGYLDVETIRLEELDPLEMIEITFQATNDPEYQWSNYVDINPTGAFTLEFPYYPHAIQATIRHPSGARFEINLSEYNRCNMNNICEFERGETRLTCPSDCASDNLQFSQATQQELTANQGVIRDTEGTLLVGRENPEPPSNTPIDQEFSDSPSYLLLIGGIILIAGALGAWVLVKKFR